MKFNALNSPSYRRFWLGSIASIGSVQLYFVGLAWLVFELSGSPFDLGILGATIAIPTIFSTLIGGIMADRIDRRKLLLVTTSMTGIVLIVLTLLDATELILVWHVFLLAALLGLIHGFEMPARSSLFPSLINSNQMMSAVALNTILWQGTRMILPVIGGLLIAVSDTVIVFALSALGFFAMTAVLKTIKIETSLQEAGKASDEFFRGVRFVIENRIFRTLIVLTFSLHFFVTSYIQIMPVFADLLGGDERTYGLLLSIQGIGSVIGTFTVRHFQQSKRLGMIIVMFAVLSPATLLGFAFLTSFPISGEGGFLLISFFVVISAIFGAAFLVSSMTVLQLIVPDDLRGRVMGIHSITFSLIPLGGLLIGALASAFTPSMSVTIGSLISLLAVFWIVRANKEIWRLNGENMTDVQLHSTPIHKI